MYFHDVFFNSDSDKRVNVYKVISLVSCESIKTMQRQVDSFRRTLIFMGIILAVWSPTNLVDAAKDIPIVHVTAVAGDPVYLPCDISPPSTADAVLLVLWYREDLGTPIYSVDGRERDFSAAERWSDERVFGSRAYFMADRKPAELGVDHARATDAGVYRCRVDFRTAQTRNAKVNLTVIVPPQKIVITDDTGLERTSVVGPFSEGASFTLRCDVFGGRPTPKVTWYRNDVAVATTNTASSLGPGAGSGPVTAGIATALGDGRVRAELSVRQLTRSDVHSELTCRARNNERTQPLAATLHVDMNFGPLDVRILGAHQPLSAGRRYELLCQSSGSRPPASVTWWRDGQRLDKTKETTSSDGNTTTSTLSFVATKDDAGKFLACRAENPVVNSEALEDGWRLDIFYSPEARIALGTSLDADNIREGADVYFDCLIAARPTVYKVEWRHNGRTLAHNVASGVVISNQSLVLQRVSRSTAGNYTCVGYNTEGDSESKPFYLNVLYAPTCRPNQTRVHGVAKQERARISCAVDANPAGGDVSFRWTFNNSAESVDVAASHVARAPAPDAASAASVVTYTPMTELDYGSLLCWASNRIGTQRAPCVYHIIAAGRPDQVHNCTILSVSSTSFSVRCAEGFNGGLPQAFVLEVREARSQNLVANLSSPVARFNVTRLEAGAHYAAAVLAHNAKGRAEPVVLTASTLPLPEKQLTSAERERPRTGFRFTPMMSVLIGVVSALLIVALVVVIVLRLQCAQNDSRRKRHKAAAAAQGGGSTASGHRGDRRGSSSAAASSDKSGSPVSKHESGIDGNESDEKNPDIIPVDSSDEQASDFFRKRQHVSTIETSSPNRSLLHRPPAPYIGYCTLRNGLDMVAHQKQMHQQQAAGAHAMSAAPMLSAAAGGGCTLPRQHWTACPGAARHMATPAWAACRGAPRGPAPPPRAEQPPIPLQPLALSSEDEPTVDTPLMVAAAKRESSV